MIKIMLGRLGQAGRQRPEAIQKPDHDRHPAQFTGSEGWGRRDLYCDGSVEGVHILVAPP